MNTRIEPVKLKRPKKSSVAEPSLDDLISNGSMPLSELMRHVQQLETLGELKAACNLYAIWINQSKELNKHFALFNYGGLLQAANKPLDAVAAYEAAIAFKPDFPQPYINLGLLHEKLGNTDQALTIWSQLVSRRYLEPTTDVEFLTIALNHIGRVQENRKNYRAAAEALEQSLLVNSKQAGVIQHWVHIRQKSCDWPIYKELPGITLAEMRRSTSPLAMLALTEDPAEQLVTSQSFVARTYAIKEEFLCKGKKYSHARTRVGYVSADFREHAVGFLLPPMLDGHDRKKYELFAYDFTAEENTAQRATLKSKFEHFRSIHHLNDRQAAELIAADEIDILIDLHGLSSGARPGIFALHPAPQQGTYLGFIGPTGMPWFDFVVADRKVLPEELSLYFTEKPLYVDGSFIPLISNADNSIKRSRQELDIPEHAFVMGAFGNIYKITPEMFASWMRLLKRIPNSLLWLIDDNAVSTANLKEHIARHGIEQGRVLFTPRTAHADFCARLKLVDIYLDTYPYNCGSTTNDVVNAGIPMVTLYGKTMVSRMGLSILSAVNCEHNATRSIVEYEDKVVELSLKSKAGKLLPILLDGHSIRMDQALEKIDSNLFPPADIDCQNQSKTLKLKIFHISNSDESEKIVPANFISLENSGSKNLVRNEYDVIRNYLMTHDLDDDVFYGFLSENFSNSTNLDFDKIQEFAKHNGAKNDVLIFSPFWDFSSLFLNSFLQGEFFHPGLLNYLEKFSTEFALDFEPAKLVAHTDNTVFCNYFIAKKRFWQHWLELGEKLLSFHAENELKDEHVNKFNSQTGKVFAQERLVNILLANNAYKSKAFDAFRLRPSATPLNQYFEQGLVGNSLKISYCKTGEPQYLDAYLRLQKQILELSKIKDVIQKFSKSSQEKTITKEGAMVVQAIEPIISKSLNNV